MTIPSWIPAWAISICKWIWDKFFPKETLASLNADRDIKAEGDITSGKFNSKSGDNCHTNQAENQKIITTNQGSNSYNTNNGDINLILSVSDKIGERILTSVFGELSQKAKTTISQNQILYYQELKNTARNINVTPEKLKEIADSPDFQYISKQAIVSASRSSSEDLHKNLSSLIIERINRDKDDFQRIIYDEAILTMNKLTLNQMKIISLCLGVKYLINKDMSSWETLNNYLNKVIKPFLNFRDLPFEFQHIKSIGCVSAEVGSFFAPPKLLSILIERNPFMNLIEKKDIDDLNLDESFKNEIFALDSITEKYTIKIKNKKNLKTHLIEKGIEKSIMNKILSAYQKNISDPKDVLIQIKEKTDIGENLLNRWENSIISRLSLTPVGMVIAKSYYEQVTEEKINIDPWLSGLD